MRWRKRIEQEREPDLHRVFSDLHALIRQREEQAASAMTRADLQRDYRQRERSAHLRSVMADAGQLIDYASHNCADQLIGYAEDVFKQGRGR